MPRVFSAKKNKGGKPYFCSQCGGSIQPGQTYKYFSRYRSSTRTIRCDKLACAPKDSELTSSETLGEAYSIRESLETSVNGAGCRDDVVTALEEAISGLESLQGTIEDKISNLENAFPNGCPALTTLEEHRDNAEQWLNDLEAAKGDVEGLEPEDDDIDPDDDDRDMTGKDLVDDDDPDENLLVRAQELGNGVDCPF